MSSTRRTRRWVATTVATLAAVGVIAWMEAGTLLPPVAGWLDVGRPPQHTDWIYVLPGDPRCRPFMAAMLLKQGFADQAMISQAESNPVIDDGIEPPQDELTQRVLRWYGVAPDRIHIVAGASTSTRDDFAMLASILAESPRVTVTVVTSHYHTRRARWMLRRLLGTQASRVTLVSAPTDEFGADDWWRSPVGTQVILSEYLKLAYYTARYGHGLWWFAGVVTVVLAIIAGRRWRRVRRR